MAIETNGILSDWSQKRVLAHGLMWVLFTLLFIVSFIGVQPLEKSIVLVSSIIGFSLPAVYFHFYLVEKFFRQKKIILYAISVIALVVIYGRLMNYVFDIWIFPDEKETYIVGEFILAVFLLMASGLHSFISGLQAKSQLSESEAKKTKAELELLKMQLNPHFLFNSLNNIYGLMEEDSDSAQALLKLSSLLRYMLDSSDKSLVKLVDEVQFIEDYIAMEQLRLNDCDVSLSLKGAFTGYKIPPFLMIPFVENAFKHGKLYGADSFVHVTIGVESNELNFVINNLKRKNKVNGHQIGINNVRRRLGLLNKPHTLNVQDDDEIFSIKLKLKL